MVVDTTLKDDKFSVQAYISRTLALGDKVLATEFVEIPCDTIIGDIERVGGEFGFALRASAPRAGHGGNGGPCAED